MFRIDKICIILLLVLFSCKTNNKSKIVNEEKKEEQASAPKPKEQVKDETEEFAGKGTDDCEMIRFEGGSFMMGSNNRTINEKPQHKVDVKSFSIDKHPVTVAQFRKFIEATGYKTDAEKFGDAGIYNYKTYQWELVKGATWDKPMVNKKAEDKHPVTQVSWRDAVAYAKWVGKRLPTEIEWEYAAVNGNSNGMKYPWGDDPFPNGKYKANIWVDKNFPVEGDDGYEFTSPVGAFGEHPSGLTDMSGNVHEWTSTVFAPYPGSDRYYRYNEIVKVIRGGAFTADEGGVNGFTTTFRGQNTWETSLFNTGFRCAKD